MKAIRSIIKTIDRFFPFKEMGITLLTTFTLLILIEYIWDGSIAHILNMNLVVVAAIILAYLIIAAILIRYIRRSIHIRQRNIQRLKTRMLNADKQDARTGRAAGLTRSMSALLLILPSILLALIAVETVREGSVSYYINLNYLIIGIIVTEAIAILAIIVILGRQSLNRKVDITGPDAKPRILSRKAEKVVEKEKPAAAAPAETMTGSDKKRWAGRVARVAPVAVLLILLVAILIALAVSSIWENSLPGQINQLRIAAVVLTVIAVWFNRSRANTSLLFMISVIFLALPQLMNVVIYFEEAPTVTLRVNSFLNTFSPIAIAAGAIAGLTYVHRNRDKITTIFEKKKNGESISRNRNLLYKFLPLILVMITLALTLPRLGNSEFQSDEFQVVDAAAGYYHTGDFYKWDWLTNAPSDVYYDRAWPHTFMIAMSYKLFGISEWSSRIVSVFWFTILVLATYFIGKKISNRNFAFLFTIVVAMSTSYIFLARYTRMYVVLIPVFFIASCFLYRGLFTGKPHTKFRILSGLKLNYLYLILGGLTFYFSYLIHLNTILYVFGFFIFMVIWMFKNKYWAYLKPVVVLSIAAVTILFIILFTNINLPGASFAGIPPTPRYEYISNLFQYPFGIGITMVLLITGIPIFLHKPFLIYSLILPISALIILVFFTTRYSGWAYICNFTPFVILLSAVCLYFFITVFFKKKLLYKFTLIFISLFIIISGFCLEAPQIYGKADVSSNFKEAYAVINQNYTEDEVIIGQYLRTYYIDPVNAEKAQVVDMLHHQLWTYEEFIATVNSYDSGWITWQSNKGYHIIRDIKNYIYANFEKIHGIGVDDTGVEVYRFNNSE